MTVQEAIRDIQRLSSSCKHSGDCMACNICYKAVPMAIECMKEVEQYRALGTVEEIKKKIKTELPYMSLAQARFKSELDEYRKIGTVEELKEAMEKQPKADWIPCETELPPQPNENPLYENKPLEVYLVSVENWEEPIRAFWNGRDFTNLWSKLNVEAWQSLPAPYKKEGAENE